VRLFFVLENSIYIYIYIYIIFIKKELWDKKYYNNRATKECFEII